MEKFEINFRKTRGKRKVIVRKLERHAPNLKSIQKQAENLMEKFGATDFTIWQDGKQIE